MTFALEMDTYALWTFASPEEAMVYCEIYDVLEDGWKFFAHDGVALKPEVAPTGKFIGLTIPPSTYDLRDSMRSGGPGLSTFLPKVRYLERGPFKSVAEVAAHLAKFSSGGVN